MPTDFAGNAITPPLSTLPEIPICKGRNREQNMRYSSRLKIGKVLGLTAALFIAALASRRPRDDP